MSSNGTPDSLSTWATSAKSARITADARCQPVLQAKAPASWPYLIVCFIPVGLAILAPVTALSSYTWLRAVLVVLLGMVALGAPRYYWRVLVRDTFGLFITFLVASTIWSSNRSQTLYTLGNFSLELVAALAIMAVFEPRESLNLVNGFLKISLVASAAIAIMLPSVGRMSSPGHPWQGIFVHKNSLGAIAAFAVPLFATQPRVARRLPWLVFALATLLASNSQGALAAALLSLGVMGLAARVYAGASGSRMIFISLIALTAIAGTAAFNTALTVLGRDESLTGRTTVWALALDYASNHRLLGDGLGAQIYEGSTLYRDISAARGDPYGVARALGTTHNGFIALYLGVGLIGCAVFALLLIKALRLIDQVRRLPIPGAASSVCLALGLLTSYLALNLTGDLILSRGGWFFLCFGLCQLLALRRWFFATDTQTGSAL